jgi:hypothetical protein
MALNNTGQDRTAYQKYRLYYHHTEIFSIYELRQRYKSGQKIKKPEHINRGDQYE